LTVDAGYINSLKKTADNLTSGCPILAMDDYVMRHDKVCTHLHYSICIAVGTETTGRWYPHPPKPVYEQEYVTALWNQGVHTETGVTANRPDVIIKNKKYKTSILIVVAIPADRNVA
jgi:hypothetical protein